MVPQDSESLLPARDWKLGVPAPVAEVATPLNPKWNEHACAECHEVIAREWAETRHGQAWNEEVYQEELATIKKQSKCTSCHAPEPLLVNGIDERVVVRDTDLHFGVDCNSCHLGPDGVIQGPWGAATDAHPSKQNELFGTVTSNELCLPCHSRSVGPVIGIGRDFDDAELADQGFTCVGCHMAPVERRIATGDELTARPGRSHRLQTPRDPGFLRQAFRIEASRTEAGALIEISNRAGHRVPGLNDRFLVFELELRSGADEVLVRDSLEISRSEPLRVAETLSLELEAPGAARLHVRGVHEAESLSEDVVFVDESLELDR